MEEKFYDKLKELVKNTLGEKGSHDFNHVEGVYNYAIIISKGLNVDMDIIKASALLHDISKETEKKEKIKDHAAQGAIEARKILEKTSFPKEKIELVCKCILLHNKKEDLPEIKEVRILKEADGLEAVGAIGIAREFSFNGENNAWDNFSPNSPLSLIIKKLSSDYFKLPIAKELAKKKLELMKLFYDSFIKERLISINN